MSRRLEILPCVVEKHRHMFLPFADLIRETLRLILILRVEYLAVNV